MKNILFLGLLLNIWSVPLLAEDITLKGKGTIYLKYPENFQENKRYIRKGIRTHNGDCEFTTNITLRPGERVYGKTIAYNPYTCESLIIEHWGKIESHKQ